MLTPLEIVEQLSVDEFIAMCQYTPVGHKKGFRRFDVLDIQRSEGCPLQITIKCSCKKIEIFEVFPWQISA